MEWWSYVSDGKGLVCDESVSADDAIARGKNGSMSWDFKTPFNFGSNLVCPSQEGIANQGFMGFSFPQMMRKSVSNTSNGDDLGMKVGGDQVVFNPITANQNSFSEEEESSSRISSSVVESNSRDSGLIDLKLGRFGDQRDVHSNPNSGSTESSIVPAKRMRVGSFGSQTLFCQVFGCKKNLSSCKDYHKRHKVCEVHSKTAKVIVKGLEQRFCQQCSRFHLLTEFDDDKRSCRKRLAGHNERRRKPQVGGQNRPGWLFSAYNCTIEGSAGSRFKGSTAAPSSYISPGILPNGIHYPQKHGANEWARHIKLEDGTSYDPQSTVSVTDGKVHSTALQSFGCKSYYPPLHEFETNSTMQSKSDGNTNQYSQNSRLSNFVSPSFFQSCSIGDREEDFAIFDSASAVGIASDTALSLLSSPSPNSSSSSRIPMAHPLLIPGSQNAHQHGTEVSENLMLVGLRALVTGVSNNCHSSGISSMEETHLDPLLISDDSNAATFGLEGLFQGSEFNNHKDQFCSEDGSTIDLLQLSSQLQRVEHQREGLRVKPEDDTFFGLSIY